MSPVPRPHPLAMRAPTRPNRAWTSSLLSTHKAHNIRRGRGARQARPSGHDVRNIDGRVDEQCRRQGLRQHTRRGHDTDLSHTCMSGVSRTRVDDVVVENSTTTDRCFTRCFTRTTIRRRPHQRTHRTPRRRPRTNRTHTAQRPQVVAGRRQRRHVAHGHLHDAGNRRGRSVRVTQACAPRRTVGASTTHRHRRRPHRHQHAARSHGHRQVAARIGGVPLRDAAQVEARAGNIHTTDGLGGNAHCPAPLAHTRQQATGRRPHRRLHNARGRRGRQGSARDVRGPHRLDVPCGNERPDHRVERSPGRLRERQRATQQAVGVLAHDEAGAGLRGIGPATGCTATAPRRSGSSIQARDLGRNPENTPQVLVARHDLDNGVDDSHAVPAPADDVDAGAHRRERRAPRGRSIPSVTRAGDTGGTGHGLVPRTAPSAPRAHRLSCRSRRRRRPWWSRSGREC